MEQPQLFHDIRLGVVKVSFGVDLQTHRKLMKVLCDLVVVIQHFVKIYLIVVVEVMQHSQLVSASKVDLC